MKLLYVIAMVWAVPSIVHASEIVVTSKGSASAQPNYARVDININTTADSKADAARLNGESYTMLTRQLQLFGVESNKVFTTNFNTQTLYKGKKRNKIRGYRATHSIYLVLRDLDRVAELLNLLADTGAASVARVTWSTTKMDSLRREALARSGRKRTY